MQQLVDLPTEVPQHERSSHPPRHCRVEFDWISPAFLCTCEQPLRAEKRAQELMRAAITEHLLTIGKVALSWLPGSWPSTCRSGDLQSRTRRRQRVIHLKVRFTTYRRGCISKP